MRPALAARTPAAESSKTRLAKGLELRGLHDGETIAKAKMVETPIDQFERGRTRQTHRAAFAGQVNRAHGTGQEHAFALDELAHALEDLVNHCFGARRRPGILCLPMVHDLNDEHSLGRAVLFVRDRHAKSTKDLEFGLVPKDLGVNEQAIHVKQCRAHGHPVTLAHRRTTVSE